MLNLFQRSLEQISSSQLLSLKEVFFQEIFLRSEMDLNQSMNILLSGINSFHSYQQAFSVLFLFFVMFMVCLAIICFFEIMDLPHYLLDILSFISINNTKYPQKIRKMIENDPKMINSQFYMSLCH
jgi:hypothetical protein